MSDQSSFKHYYKAKKTKRHFFRRLQVKAAVFIERLLGRRTVNVDEIASRVNEIYHIAIMYRDQCEKKSREHKAFEEIRVNAGALIRDLREAE